MGEAANAQLRGYDSFRVSLGDEMRGERASLGKSLLDVQRDLRIKAAHIDAIENAEPDAIPHRGFVTGYVRAYARYLGMNEDAVLRRFCEESGFEPSAGSMALTPSSQVAKAPGRRDDLDAVIAGSKLAAASRAAAYSADFGSTLRGLGSLGVLVALVGGLGYGGWALLENIQRVQFAPAPVAPEALASAPDIETITRIARAGAVPAPMIDAAALAAVYALQEIAPPRLEPRDGPISALDPDRSGVYAARDAAELAAVDGPLAAALARGPEEPVVVAAPSAEEDADADAAQPLAVARGVALVAAQEAWVRVRNATGAVAHEALMQAGQVWRVPEDAEGFTLRAGNAGGVFIEVDGRRFGPLGRPGGVVSNVLLDAEAVRSVFPVAEAPGADAPAADALRSASVGLPGQ